MRNLVTGIVLLVSVSISYSQSIVPGKLLVRFSKTGHTAVSGRTGSVSVGGLQFTPKALAPVGAPRRGTKVRTSGAQPSIPIERYYELTFDPSTPVEEVRQALLAKGIAEKAEPVYVESIQYTPNDPQRTSQWYLTKIKAEAAWDVTKGSDEVVIAIIDSGGDLDHPDLASQLFHNEDDPINGIDDDGNGYVDDYTGWDFSGNDTLNVFNANWEGDNNPSIFSSGAGFTHGTGVASCAAAATDNGVGISGIGFNSKLLFTKHFADNQKSTSTSYNSNLYLGILYAAYMGADIINCSWGGGSPSGIYQDLINFVTNDLGCLVVAAAGNSGNNSFLYPASYDNVLSVAASNSEDVMAGFTNRNSAVDITAPGVDILRTTFDNAYASDQGTSFSAPIVSGAAALVKALHPDWTPQQIGEQLRVTSDKVLYTKNPTQTGKLGYGRLDVHAALTKSLPSVRVANEVILTDKEELPLPGEEANLYFDITNYLAATTSAFKIELTTSGSAITLITATIQPGVIASGQTLQNKSTPFRIKLSNSILENQEVEITLKFTDTGYEDTQTLTFIPKPSFRLVNENLLLTSVGSTGRIGWDDPANQTNGAGFVFDETSMLFEMGLLLSDGAGLFFNNVRGNSSSFDQDFVSTRQITKVVPGLRSDAEIVGEFSNNLQANNQKIKVRFNSMVWKQDKFNKFFIVEYTLVNPTSTAINNLRLGLFADWDVTNSGGNDYADLLEYGKVSFIKGKTDANSPLGAIQLLTSPATGNIYAIDNNQALAGNPFGLYDGYTDTEKVTTLTSSKLTAGAAANGGDVSHVVSAGPVTIAAKDSVKIAFAIHGTASIEDLTKAARAADTLYNFTFKAPMPVVDTVQICYLEDATLMASGASSYAWYTQPVGGNPIAIGNSISLSQVKRDTVLYVANTTNIYGSLRTPAVVVVRAQPIIEVSRSAQFCANESITLTAQEGTTYTWSTGATSRSITVSTAGTFQVTVSVVEEGLNCLVISEPVTTSLLAVPQAAFAAPEEIFRDQPASFTDQSTGAIAWSWSFGDGGTSTSQNPSYTYDDVGEALVQLVVTSGTGCKDTATLTYNIITSIEPGSNRALELYPNPTTGRLRLVGVEATDRVTLFDLSGKQIELPPNSTDVLDLSLLHDGVYLLCIQNRAGIRQRKIILRQEQK